MRKYLLGFVLVFLTSSIVFATELKVPKLTGRVVDRAGVLSSSERKVIENYIFSFEQATHGQMAVLIISSLRGDSLEMFSMRVAEKWKIGSKGKDNGLLLLVSIKDRKIRLEVGYGFEGNLNDARAGDIIRGMKPYFRAGKYGAGIEFAVIRAQEFITGKQGIPPPSSPRNYKSSRKQGSFIFNIIFIVIILILNIGFRRRGFIILSSGGYGSSGGFGGFSGGGGSFGGGGASGGW